jgi:hypothetical protein
MNETWLPVPGYESLYEVSDHGRVRSMDRLQRRGPAPGMCYRRGRILKPMRSTVGRLKVGLYSGGARRMFLIHRLVLEAFVGPCPDGMEACHYDDDPDNNHLSNLRWDTRLANRADLVRNGIHWNTRKTHCLRGHEFTPDNTYYFANVRHCRRCRTVRSALRSGRAAS